MCKKVGGMLTTAAQIVPKGLVVLAKMPHANPPALFVRTLWL